MRSSQDGASGGGFRSWLNDRTHDLGTSFDLLLTEDISALFSYSYHWGKGETNGGGSATDFPSIKDNLQVFSATFDCRLRSELRLEFGYRFERFNGTDFQFDRLGLIPPASNATADVQMSNNVSDYEAHIVGGRFIYEF